MLTAAYLDQRAPYEEMGPTLLAMQPMTPVDWLMRDEDNWEAIFEHCESALTSARNWRYSWWGHWARLAEFFKPRRYHWLVVANRMDRGVAINDNIIDCTGPLAVNICSSGMWSGMTNPSRPWINIGTQDEEFPLDGEGKTWLEDLADVVYTLCDGSNFYTEMAQAFEDLVVFGTAPIIIYEDFEDVIRLYTPCAGEYYLKAGSRFSIDTIIREFTLTVSQIVEMFTFKECPANVQLDWRNGGASRDKEYVVCQIIEPNYDILRKGDGEETIKVVPGKFVYREIYWLRGMKGNKPLSKRGFQSKPFMAMRWAKTSNDPYGRSACMDALGDNKQVQRSTLRKGEFIEKLVRPPMGADVTLKNEPSSILPGMTNYMPTGGGDKKFWPLFEMQAAALGPLVEDIKEVNERIKSTLFVDVFLAITQMEGVEPRNELELTKRDMERLQRLGPVINLVTGELRNAITRIIDIAKRRGLVRPMPKSLRGVPLKIEFTTLMRLAQRSAESIAMKDTFATMGELSSAAKAATLPDPLRNFDLDKSARRYADRNNFPADCLFTPVQVQQHDKIRAQELAKAQAPGAAMAGVAAAKTLSQTPIGGNTALSALTGGGAGGGLGAPGS
jgi:hypothetical protein